MKKFLKRAAVSTFLASTTVLTVGAAIAAATPKTGSH